MKKILPLLILLLIALPVLSIDLRIEAALKEIRRYLNADSLHYLSLEGMMKAVGREGGYCNACFTGVYPIDVDFERTKTGFENAIK